MGDLPVTRRELLRRSAGAVLAAGATGAIAYWLHNRADRASPAVPAPVPDYFGLIDFPPSAPRLSVAVGSADETERLVRAAVGGLDPVLGMRRFIAPGDRVLIKPNVGFDRPPHLGATTNPDVLRWIIRLCREAGAAEILVTDHPIEAAEACFLKSGIGPAVAAEGARLLFPRPRDFRPVAAPEVEASRSRPEVLAGWPALLGPLQQVTKLVGVAPVKDHNLCSASIILKNWYGLLGGRRNQLHQAIHETISDLALLFSPALVVADATRVLMRSGPTGGRASDVQPGGLLGRPTVVAAVDPVACDAWCYERLLGRDPAQLGYLSLAQTKIQAQVRGGRRRFGESRWRSYEERGQVVITGL